jgi:hypothetical protein
MFITKQQEVWFIIQQNIQANWCNSFSNRKHLIVPGTALPNIIMCSDANCLTTNNLCEKTLKKSCISKLI